MHLKIPKSAQDILSNLRFANTRLAKARGVGADPRMTALEAELNEAWSQYRQALVDLDAAARERRRLIGRLAKTVRDFYRVLKLTADRDARAEVWLVVFTRERDLPINTKAQTIWLAYARAIGDRHAWCLAQLAANAEAFPAALPSNPSAEEVAARLVEAEQADQLWRDASRRLESCAAALRLAKHQAQTRLTALRLELWAAMVGKPAAERRKELALHGFQYKPARNSASSTAELLPDPGGCSDPRADLALVVVSRQGGDDRGDAGEDEDQDHDQDFLGLEGLVGQGRL